MEAVAVVEMSAVGARERLAGLVEQGGRKSLQPTLFRLGESAARYESLQQLLADSPWDPGVLVRACAERVAPQLGRYRVDRRRHRD
jgi:hypothetical protein